MVKEEVMKILYILQAMYLDFFKSYTEKEYKNLVDGWYMILADYPYDKVANAVKTFIASDTKGFPPKVGQIVEMIGKLYQKSEIDDIDVAWNKVAKASQNSYYNSEEEFNKLPEICKRIVGSSRALKSYGNMSEEEFNTVIKSHFFKSYRTISQEVWEGNKIPNDVKLSLQENKQNLIEEE